MAQQMLKFVKIANRMPDKREADARRKDFDEIYGEFRDEEARVQAGAVWALERIGPASSGTRNRLLFRLPVGLP